MQLIYFDRVVLNSVSVLSVACQVGYFCPDICGLCVCRGRASVNPAPQLTLFNKKQCIYEQLLPQCCRRAGSSCFPSDFPPQRIIKDDPLLGCRNCCGTEGDGMCCGILEGEHVDELVWGYLEGNNLFGRTYR